MRTLRLTMSTMIFALTAAGCSVPDGSAQRNAEIRACHLDGDTSITADVGLHACSPGQSKKTTICHLPPGNPSNAHTLCVGNAAVPAHIDHHNDTLGPCPEEPPCDGGEVDAGAGSGSGSGGVIL